MGSGCSMQAVYERRQSLWENFTRKSYSLKYAYTTIWLHTLNQNPQSLLTKAINIVVKGQDPLQQNYEIIVMPKYQYCPSPLEYMHLNQNPQSILTRPSI